MATPDTNGRPQVPTVSRPDPDPTVLTTDAIIREITMLRELLEARMAGLSDRIARQQVEIDELPGLRHEAIEALKTLHDERFKSIATQFIERDTRVEQTAKDSKVAVDAALSAAKEAVTEQNKSTALAIAKSEAAFFKQLDQLVLLVGTQISAITVQIGDMKNWQTRNEGRAGGINALYGWIATGVVAVLAVAGFLLK